MTLIEVPVKRAYGYEDKKMSQLGGAPRCPRCENRVYFAEEKIALGKSWHKNCFKCVDCNKFLDSTNCNEHNDELYCKVCYRKLQQKEKPKWEQPAAGSGDDVDCNDPERCPRCGKKVFFAEEKIALGRKWHKLCFKCASCNKLMDSVNCTEHGEDLFCKSCYGRKFGPKGYGFAGGASGLSMDTGKRGYVTRETASESNVSSYNAAQAAPIIERQMSNQNGNSNNGVDYNAPDRCPRCGNRVYFAEEKVALGRKWHKLCFKCAKCGKLLDSTSSTEHGDEVFCRSCYGRNFGPKGYGFAGGASGLSMDTGKIGQISRDNVPATDKAYIAPVADQMSELSLNGGGDIERRESAGGWGNNNDGCPRCGKTVYIAEKMQAAGRSYHKTCFSCYSCKKKVDSGSVQDRDNEIYCKACYGRNFGPRGYGYGTGAGILQTT